METVGMLEWCYTCEPSRAGAWHAAWGWVRALPVMEPIFSKIETTWTEHSQTSDLIATNQSFALAVPWYKAGTVVHAALHEAGGGELETPCLWSDEHGSSQVCRSGEVLMWVDYKQNITIPLADAQTGDMFLGTARMELTCLGVETTHFLKHRCVSVCASVMKMFSECLWYHLIEVGKYKFWSIQHAVDPQRLCKPGALKVFFFWSPGCGFLSFWLWLRLWSVAGMMNGIKINSSKFHT